VIWKVATKEAPAMMIDPTLGWKEKPLESTVNETVVGPLPVAGLVMWIQSAADCTLQEHPLVVCSITEPTPPLAANVAVC
jgi:hypothetical protein